MRSLVTGRRGVMAGVVVAAVLVATLVWRGTAAAPSLTVAVERGTLAATLTASGTLRPVQSLTYRSPVAGREMEIVELAPEGARVETGDLVVRLDTTELERDLQRLSQELRQAQLELQVAEGEAEEAEAAVRAAVEGEGALAVDEARTQLQLAEKRAARLRQEHAELQPLYEKGFLTRDELARTGDQLEQAEAELLLLRKRTGVVVGMTHPRELKRTELQRAQKASALQHVRTRLAEATTKLAQQTRLIDAATMYARHPGLVVYEEILSTMPRRKVRVGDRVFPSQGIVTIPGVSRMLVEASVSEADVHRVSRGQPAEVRLEAYPDLRLSGRVGRVGTLASGSVQRPIEDKRFDLVVELDPTAADLRPEMTARADITIGVREGVLLAPVAAIFARPGGFVVHVAGRWGVETRRVSLGLSNDRQVEVLDGVLEQERLLLTEPDGSSAASSGPAPPAGTATGHVQPR